MAVSEGYPDYQRVQTRALAPLVNEVFDTGGVVTDMGVYYVSNYPELLFKFIGDNTATYDITFQWYADAAKTLLIYTKSVAVTGNVPVLAEPVKVAGPWLNIHIVPTNWVAGLNVQLIVVPSYNPMSVRELNDTFLLAESARSVAAASTDTVYLNAVIEGPCVWYWNSGATSWSLQLQELTSGGTWHTRFQVSSGGPAALGYENVALQARPYRVQFMNNDASSKLWSSTIAHTMY